MNRKEHFPQGFNNWNVYRDAWKEILTHHPQHTRPLGGDGGLPAWMGRGMSTSTPTLPPPLDPCSDLFLHLGQKQIPVMAFNTCVAFLPTAPLTNPATLLSVPPHGPSGCQADPSFCLEAPRPAPPRPAEAPDFIASNFTLFCFSLTWPRPLTSFPYPFQLVRISPAPQRLGFLPLPSSPACGVRSGLGR